MSLSNEKLKNYLQSLVQNREVYNPTRLREATVRLVFPVNIFDTFARIVTYCADSFERLDLISYGEFKSENLKHKIKILLYRVRPQLSRWQWENALRLRLGSRNI